MDQKFSSQRGRIFAFSFGILLLIAGIGFALRDILTFPSWPLGTDNEVYLHAANAIEFGLTPYSSVPGLDPYPYPPLFAESIIPLTAIFGTGKGWLIWAFSGIFFLLASIAIMSRAFEPKIPISFVVLLGGVFCMSHIVRNETLHGQINFLMAFLVVAGAFLWQRGYNIAAACPWALAIVTKPFLGLLVLFLLRKSDFRGALATLALSAILFIGSFVLAFSNPLQIFHDWRISTQWYTGIPHVAKPDNQTFYAFFVRLFVDTQYSTSLLKIPFLPTFLILPIVAMSGYIFVLSVGRKKNLGDRGAPKTLLEIAVTLGLFMTCGPLMEGDHVFVLLPGLFGAVLLYLDSRDRRWLIASALWALAFANLFLPMGLNQFRPNFWPKLEGMMILRSLHYGLIFFLAAAYSGFALWTERSKNSNSDPREDGRDVSPNQGVIISA